MLLAAAKCAVLDYGDEAPSQDAARKGGLFGSVGFGSRFCPLAAAMAYWNGPPALVHPVRSLQAGNGGALCVVSACSRNVSLVLCRSARRRA